MKFKKILTLSCLLFTFKAISYPCSIKYFKSDTKSIFLISDYHLSYNKVNEIIPNVNIKRFNNYNLLSCERAFLRCLEKINPITSNKIDLFWESSENIHKYFISNSIFNTFLQLPFLKSFIQDLENINFHYVDTWRGLFNYYSDLPEGYKRFIKMVEKLILDILPIQIKQIEELENIKTNHRNYLIMILNELLNRLNNFYKVYIYPNKDSQFCQALMFPPKNNNYIGFWDLFNKLFIVDLADYKMLTDLLTSESKNCILYAGAMHNYAIEKILKTLDFKLITEKFKNKKLNKLLLKFYEILNKNYALLDGISTKDDIKFFKKLSLVGPMPINSSSFNIMLKYIS